MNFLSCSGYFSANSFLTTITPVTILELLLIFSHASLRSITTLKPLIWALAAVTKGCGRTAIAPSSDFNLESASVVSEHHAILTSLSASSPLPERIYLMVYSGTAPIPVAYIVLPLRSLILLTVLPLSTRLRTPSVLTATTWTLPCVLLYILAARLDGTAAISISPVASGVTNADASVAKSSNAYVFLVLPFSESLRSLTIPIAVGPAIAPILIVVVSSV